MKPSGKQLALTFGFIALLVFISGAIAYLSNSGETQWYQSLEKPPLQPPGFVFGIVWPILYALMGLAAALVYFKEASPVRTLALRLFTVQLLVNYVWSFLFFSAHLILISLVWIGMLIVLVGLTERQFAKLDSRAGLLLLPYIAWLGFAFYLNAGIFYLNGA